MPHMITVNGAQHDVDADDDTPLLWVLRDILGLTGTKFGCGMALCGACTVHVDGVPTRSCVTPLDSAVGEAPGGMGEPGTSVVGTGIGNAIFAATGKRLRKMPFEAALLKA